MKNHVPCLFTLLLRMCRHILPATLWPSEFQFGVLLLSSIDVNLKKTIMEDPIVMPPPEPMQDMDENLEMAPMELSNDNEEKEGVIKVSNISPQANLEQMKKLFGFLGNVQELVLYPKGYVFLLVKLLFRIKSKSYIVPSKTCFYSHVSF